MLRPKTRSPPISTLSLSKYNLESKKTYEKASLQSALTKDEKFPNIDTLAIKYNLEPKSIKFVLDCRSNTTLNK